MGWNLSLRLTGVRLRKSVGLSVSTMDRESLDALDALEIHKAIERNTRCPGGKTKHFRPFVTIERLERSPPPNNDRFRAMIADIFCCRSPFIHVDIWSTGNEQLQFLLVELK